MNPFKKASSNGKRKFSRATGIPTTKSGRKKKADKIINQIIGFIILIVALLFFLNK